MEKISLYKTVLPFKLEKAENEKNHELSELNEKYSNTESHFLNQIEANKKKLDNYIKDLLAQKDFLEMDIQTLLSRPDIVWRQVLEKRMTYRELDGLIAEANIAKDEYFEK